MFEQPKPILPKQEGPDGPLGQARKKLGLVRAAARDAFFEHVDNPDAAAPWDVLADTNKGKFIRTQALFGILRDAIPDEVFNRLTLGHYQYKPDELAIDPKRYAFEAKKLDNGGECNVYRLISQDPEYPTLVIKIDKTTRQNVDVLVERGKMVRKEYEEKKEWYRDLPELIPEELQFIGKSPRGGRIALFTLQEYFGTADQIHDLFHGYTEAELVALLGSDPKLAESFRIFAKATLDRAEVQDEMIDTLGNKNIAIVDRPEGRRLILLDAHVVHHPKHPGSPEDGERIQVHLDFLRRVLAAIG
ncbi:MAG: hypothetical protein ACEQSB_05630 [Undibacterium sp.]